MAIVRLSRRHRSSRSGWSLVKQWSPRELWSLIVFIPSVTVAVRQYHHADMVVEGIVLILVPVIGFIMLIIWWIGRKLWLQPVQRQIQPRVSCTNEAINCSPREQIQQIDQCLAARRRQLRVARQDQRGIVARDQAAPDSMPQAMWKPGMPL